MLPKGGFGASSMGASLLGSSFGGAAAEASSTAETFLKGVGVATVDSLFL